MAKFLLIAWEVLRNLPAIIKMINDFIAWAQEYQREKKAKENEAIKKEVENAKTPEEKQAAVDHAAARWGRH